MQVGARRSDIDILPLRCLSYMRYTNRPNGCARITPRSICRNQRRHEMPTVRIKPDIPQEYTSLVEALAEEIRLNRTEGPNDAPVIIEEAVIRPTNLHVTVIWDA